MAMYDTHKGGKSKLVIQHLVYRENSDDSLRLLAWIILAAFLEAVDMLWLQFITTIIFDIVYYNSIGKHATSVIKIVIVTYCLIL